VAVAVDLKYNHMRQWIWIIRSLPITNMIERFTAAKFHQ